MKILQTWVLIIVGAANTNAIVLPSPQADPRTSSAVALAKADSLFHLKQYTESFELYNKLFQFKQYSPSMLLKMAYIQEGLGHLAQSMYYLNRYYIVTRDPQALAKIEEAAGKNRLEGYDNSDATRLVALIRDNHTPIAEALAAACIFLLAFAFYQKIRMRRRPVLPATAMVFFLVLLLANNYLIADRTEGIISMPETYLMEGPSAGSSVIAIVGEGHRIEILGKKDVWLKVKWGGREVFVKEDEILPLTI